eukprot:5065863-Prymnesium_polylepis.2
MAATCRKISPMPDKRPRSGRLLEWPRPKAAVGVSADGWSDGRRTAVLAHAVEAAARLRLPPRRRACARLSRPAARSATPGTRRQGGATPTPPHARLPAMRGARSARRAHARSHLPAGCEEDADDDEAVVAVRGALEALLAAAHLPCERAPHYGHPCEPVGGRRFVKRSTVRVCGTCVRRLALTSRASAAIVVVRLSNGCRNGMCSILGAMHGSPITVTFSLRGPSAVVPVFESMRMK